MIASGVLVRLGGLLGTGESRNPEDQSDGSDPPQSPHGLILYCKGDTHETPDPRLRITASLDPGPGHTEAATPSVPAPQPTASALLFDFPARLPCDRPSE